jgi:hypothetical protein
MRKIIEDIYTGRLSAGNRTFKRGSEYEKALSELIQREDALHGKLCPDDGETLAAYAQAYANLNSISNLENFSIGFRMGAQVMLAVFGPDDEAFAPIGQGR